MDFSRRGMRPASIGPDEPLSAETDPLAEHNTPWPSEKEIDAERRLTRIEENQNRTNQLLMQLQLEYRQGMNHLAAKINKLELAVTTSMGELSGLLKKFLANGG